MDEPEFERFYRATAGRLSAYLYRVCGDRRLVDDLLQESFYRFLRSKFEGDGEEDRARYLFRIATNLLKDHWAGAKRSHELPAETSSAGTDETRLDLHAALGSLRPVDREMLWLAYAEGCSHAEISEILEVKRASVRVLLFRARARLGRAAEGRRRMNEDELRDLFQASLREASGPEPLPDPAAIWHRARAAELFEEELRRRERTARPLRTARSLAGWAALIGAELAVLAGFSELPREALEAMAQVGVAPGTAALLTLAALPAATLLYHLRRDS